MSLIHEALQKAEKERRAGELPPLLSGTVASIHRGAASPRRWMWLLPIGALAAALAYSNFDLIVSQEAKSSAVDQETSQRDDNPSRREPTIATPASKPAQVRAQPQVVLPGIPEGALPSVSAAPAEPPAMAAVTPQRRPLPEPVPLPEADTAAPPESRTNEVVAASEPERAADALSQEIAESMTDTRMATATATATAAPTSASSDAPYIFELPLATRQALPPLKVTMQVYHRDPAQRFAIIDGKRVNESGPVGNDLNLVEIQRDAILLDFRGQRFLLPRLGR